MARLFPALLLALAACERAPPPEGPHDALALLVREGGKTRRLAEGATLPADADLRLELGIARDGHVAVAAVDATGAVQPIHPTSGALPLAATRPRPLPTGLSLRVPAGPLRVVAIYCDDAPPLEAYWATLGEHAAKAGGDPRKLGPLGLESCRDRSVLVEAGGAKP